MKFIAIRLDPKTAKAIKQLALDQETTVQSLLTNMICATLKIPVPTKRGKRSKGVTT